MATNGSTATKDDVKGWLDRQRVSYADVPDELGAGSSLQAKTGGGLIEALRAAIGSPQKLTLGGLCVVVGEPRVRTLKRLISKSDVLQNSAEDDGGMGALEELQRVMLDCLEFPEGETPANVDAWFDSLPITQGIALVEAFQSVVDLKQLMGKATAISGKR